MFSLQVSQLPDYVIFFSVEGTFLFIIYLYFILLTHPCSSKRDSVISIKIVDRIHMIPEGLNNILLDSYLQLS